MAFRNMGLRQRLMAIMLATSAGVLLLTCAGFLTYEILTFRQSTLRQLSTVAAIIAYNSTAVLAFKDEPGAREILSALKAEPHIEQAGLYDAAGNLFSVYPENHPPSEFPPQPALDGFRFAQGYLAGYHPVEQGGNRLGTLFVKSNLNAVSARLRLYGAVAALVAGVALLLAYVLSRMLQRRISSPVMALAETARAVSDRGDYSVRAAREGDGEIGVLTDAFNNMLNRIQDQMARMQLVDQITRAIGDRLDLASVFQVIVGSLEENLPMDFICVCRYDAAGERLTVICVGAKAGPMATALHMAAKARLSLGGGLERCVRGEFVYEPDISGIRSDFPERLAAQGLRSLVLSPLVVESGVFGILIAARKGADRFSAGDREFLRQLSDHAALAAHQANLYLALQQAYDDLRRSQQAVMEQERLRALGQLASGIAHDINNAISPAALYTEAILERETGLSPQSREQLQTVAHAIEDVSATVARMREYSRQREPKAPLVPVRLNLSLQQVIDLTRSRWQDTPQQRGAVIEIETGFDPHLPPIMGVQGEIREAFTNLFLNAFDAMPEGGTLALRTVSDEKNRQVVVEVSDTGAGMDEETRRRCLEPFYTTKGERGTGMGLAMVYGVMERHGAQLELESAPGKGTTVRLIFAAAQVGPEADAPAKKAEPRPARRILVVDDDPLVARVLKDTLEFDGHEVETADGGRAGIEAFLGALVGRPFDVVMTDLGMPHVDGRKVAEAVKKASSATQVVLLTGWGQSLLAEGDTPPHVDRLLSKPPKLAELREALAGFAPLSERPAGA